LSFCKEP
jgi:hypothetical protein